ncbi:MAG: bifunctional 3,4-dihydroxy-2-butanone-4-phosphate synthase/GTP cyclohydrolase II [Sedimentisphaerales bacterium]|nr:bifunctional 3,4-dihydroxy-2-butanone-4-phosphate synthase/GTP cyclohydrolase II [Sedimentisphaerales bacterium]
MCFSSIESVIADLKAGKMIVLADDENRENEGDLVCAAEKVTPDIVNFMATHGRGMICLPLTNEKCDSLQLHPQTGNNTAPLQTAFTVTIDAAAGVTTGISAADRAQTIQQSIRDDCRPGELVRPGHIFPLRACDGGVLVRAGQTEGSVDLARLAGLKPAGVICEIMNPDGTMARVPHLIEFCKEHNLKMTTIAALIEYRIQREMLVKRIESVDLPTDCGVFRLIGYETLVDNNTHLALCKGDVGKTDKNGNVIPQKNTVLVRVHSECLTGDIFHSLRCDCGDQLHEAMRRIEKAGQGAIIYLRQEGRGIGLAAKLQAYHLQDMGMDTVQANEWLGYEADKRDYGIGAQICRDLGLHKIEIMTNNPIKTNRLQVYGIDVVKQIPIEIPTTEHNRRYMKTKRDKMGHLLRDV